MNMAKKTFSAGGVVMNASKQIVVVSQHGTSWSLPKGHIDPGETAEQAAHREILEECGLKDIKLIKTLGSYERYQIGKYGGENPEELKHITMYLFSSDNAELKPQDQENPEARWVNPEDVVNLLTHPKDKAFFQQVLDEGMLEYK